MQDISQPQLRENHVECRLHFHVLQSVGDGRLQIDSCLFELFVRQDHRRIEGLLQRLRKAQEGSLLGLKGSLGLESFLYRAVRFQRLRQLDEMADWAFRHDVIALAFFERTRGLLLGRRSFLCRGRPGQSEDDE